MNNNINTQVSWENVLGTITCYNDLIISVSAVCSHISSIH